MKITWNSPFFVPKSSFTGTQPSSFFKKHILTYIGGMGKEVGGMFKWEGTWVNLWLIHVDV